MTIKVPLNIAAGMLKTVADVQRFVDNVPFVDEVTVGSITRDAREGNSGLREYADGQGNYWNVLGLPNGGLAYYKTAIVEIAKIARAAGKKVILSISGFSPREQAELFCFALDYVDAVELNLACPNVLIGGDYKPLVCMDPMQTKDTLITCAEQAGSRARQVKVRLKMGPVVNNNPLIVDLARIFNAFTLLDIEAVIGTNTILSRPLNAEGDPIIGVKDAGMSGAALHPIAVQNVALWRSLLKPEINVIGVGGVREAQHVRNFMKHGASSCQMAGAYYFEGQERAMHHVMQGLV